MKVKVKDREFDICELKYTDIVGLNGIPEAEMAKKVILLSTKMSEEDFNELSVKEGLALQKSINELNGLSDFQKAVPDQS